MNVERLPPERLAWFENELRLMQTLNNVYFPRVPIEEMAALVAAAKRDAGAPAQIENALARAGFVLVPREATEEMIDAYVTRDRRGSIGEVGARVWSAMLSASEKTP